jgi:hypothetical protein
MYLQNAPAERTGQQGWCDSPHRDRQGKPIVAGPALSIYAAEGSCFRSSVVSISIRGFTASSFSASTDAGSVSTSS